MRERQFNGIIGAPGHGKSTYTAEKIVTRAKGNAIIYKADFNINDKAFAKFPYVDIEKYKGGKVKVSDANIEYKDFVRWCYRNMRNGTLVVDDASIYEQNAISKELLRLIAMRRHIGVDVYLVYHGLTGFPIDQYKFLDYLVLFNTKDEISYKRNKIPMFDKLQAAKDRISAQVARGNKYYYEAIKMQ